MKLLETKTFNSSALILEGKCMREMQVNLIVEF